MAGLSALQQCVGWQRNTPKTCSSVALSRATRIAVVLAAGAQGLFTAHNAKGLGYAISQDDELQTVQVRLRLVLAPQ
jgi:hypothetical protein